MQFQTTKEVRQAYPMTKSKALREVVDLRSFPA
jgi:hypothetical protein